MDEQSEAAVSATTSETVQQLSLPQNFNFSLSGSPPASADRLTGIGAIYYR